MNPVESAPEDANRYADLPPDLKLMVGRVLSYAHRPEMEATIAALCAWRPRSTWWATPLPEGLNPIGNALPEGLTP